MDFLFELAKGSHKQDDSEMFIHNYIVKDILSKNNFFRVFLIYADYILVTKQLQILLHQEYY